MSFHDTHFHLDLVSDPAAIASSIEQNKIYTIAVTNSPSVFNFTYELAKSSKYLRAALGLHPELAFERRAELDIFLSNIDKTRYIGEIGLDNLNKAPSDYLTQKKIFEKIIDSCSVKKDKILTLHSRRAASDVINIIGGNFPGKAILHWYSGRLRELKTAINYGFYFSVNYAMTISDSGKKIINSIPNERILLETDGPFVEYNGLPSTPLLTPLIAENVNQIKQLRLDRAYLQKLFSNNFRKLLTPEEK